MKHSSAGEQEETIEARLSNICRQRLQTAYRIPNQIQTPSRLIISTSPNKYTLHLNLAARNQHSTAKPKSNERNPNQSSPPYQSAHPTTTDPLTSPPSHPPAHSPHPPASFSNTPSPPPSPPTSQSPQTPPAGNPATSTNAYYSQQPDPRS